MHSHRSWGTNQVSSSRLLHQAPSPVIQSLLPCIPSSSTSIVFSSEGLMIGGRPVHLREESGLERDRRTSMPFVECPEQTLIPFKYRPGDDRHTPRQCARGNILLCECEVLLASEKSMACTRACVSKMEIPCVCITASPRPTTRLLWT